MQKAAEAHLPTDYGDFIISIYKTGEKEHAILTREPFSDNPLVRIHSQCLTGDTFHSKKCDCHAQLEASLKQIGKEGGIIIYLNQEGRGIGLANKIKAYALQEQGRDTVEANEELGFKPDQRSFQCAADVLKELNITAIRLLTNNPEKIKALEAEGIQVTERISLVTDSNEHSKEYMQTKKDKMGHLI
ncbi:MAG: GTP cyclohydrolase II [Nanoarchaeota archaeon]|nr:GTP cyclohydrolase II [Nanoarchaeota archaeon]